MGYMDETGICSTPGNRYAWVKRGETHQVTATRSKRVNIMGALLSTGDFVSTCLQESVTGQYFYAYIMGIAKQVKEKHDNPLIIIVDNASIHKSKQMQAWRDLLQEDYNTTLYFLPPYSPELNRIEMLWKQMKYHWRKFTWMSTDQIIEWVEDVSNQFGEKYLFTF